jgi:hypothetical protein
MRPFQAWVMGSFDEPADGTETSAHRERLFHDHALAARYGFGTVWEAAGWRGCESGPGPRDFAWLHAVLDSSRRHGLQVAWTLLDRTWPATVDPAEAGPFADRLADFAAAAAREIARTDPGPVHVYQPIRSRAVLAAPQAGPASLGARSDGPARDEAVLGMLSTATQAAAAAIHANDPKAWVVTEDVIAAASGTPDGVDGLAIVPEPAHGGDGGAAGQSRAFASLIRRLDSAWTRHRKPILVFGSGASGDARGPALEMMAQAAEHAGASGIDLHGLCISPLLDERPADGSASRCGLWSVDREGGRLAEPAYARSISRCQRAALPRRRKARPRAAESRPLVESGASG